MIPASYFFKAAYRSEWEGLPTDVAKDVAIQKEQGWFGRAEAFLSGSTVQEAQTDPRATHRPVFARRS